MNYIFNYYLDGTLQTSHNKTLASSFYSIHFSLADSEKTLNVFQESTTNQIDTYTYSVAIREPRYEVSFTSDTITFNIYAISKSSTTLAKGTYTWKLEPTLPEDGTSTTIEVDFSSNGVDYKEIILSIDKVQYVRYPSTGKETITAYNYQTDTWGTGNRVIVVANDTSLTSAQYALLVTNGNLTKTTYTYTVNWRLDSNLAGTTSFTSDYELKESDLSLWYPTFNTDMGVLQDSNGKTLSAYIYASEILNNGGTFYLDVVNNTIVVNNFSTNQYIIYGASLKRIANAIRFISGATDLYTPSEMATEILKLQSPTGTINITTTAKTDVTQYKYAQVQDNNLVASNIKANTIILGISGTFTSDATATASDIVSGKTAYVNGTKITGTHTDGVLEGNATPSQVLKGATFYNNNYTKQTGTIETYSGSTTITANGTVNTAGKYLPSNLTINVPATPTQEKSVTITTNGETSVTPDSGKNLSKVTVITNVDGVTEITTSTEMDNKLVQANVGKYYKFTGTTDDKYTNGDIYQVQDEE